MRLAIAPFLVFAAMLFAACDGDGEVDIPTQAPTTAVSPTPSTGGGQIVFCPQIGGGSTPLTPTPAASCVPSSENIEIADGVFVHKAPAPEVPAGMLALSDFYVFEIEADERPNGAFSVSLVAPDAVTYFIPAPGWYTHTDGEWTRLMDVTQLIAGDPPIVQGFFQEIPQNVIVLAENTQ